MGASVTAKDDRRALVDELDEDAAEVLADAYWLVAEGQMLVSLEGLPAIWHRDGPSSHCGGLWRIWWRLAPLS